MCSVRWGCALFAVLLALQVAPSEIASVPMTEEEIRAALQEPASLEYRCEPLRDVLEFLSKITGIEFRIDNEIFRLPS